VTALARRLERAGVDGIIAEGTESGGHVGEVTTMVLVPQVVRRGFRTGRCRRRHRGRPRSCCRVCPRRGGGTTRYGASLPLLRTPVHDNYKQAILNANDRSTVVTGRDIGAPVRAIANKMTNEFARYEKEGRPLEEFEHLAVGGLCRAVNEGDVDTGSLMAGQISGLIGEIKPVQTIIQDMVRTAAGLLQEGALD